MSELASGSRSFTVRDLVRHPPLRLSLLTSGYDEVSLNWSHSTDLDDPSPFLEPGQMVLTTGRQFAAYDSAACYEAYVSRLRAAGVVALGFGTEVLREGTPAELIEACERAGMALVEVPYATPFIAVSKQIADRLAAESRRRLEWALATQESISQAVLGSGGLAAAVRAAATALDCRLAVLDPDGVVLEGSVPAGVRDRAGELLRRGRRARDVSGDPGGGSSADSSEVPGGDPGGFSVVQTLGRSGRLLGAVVVLRREAFAPTELAVVTMLTALTELALEHAEDQRLGFRSVAQQLFVVLQGGGVEAVTQALLHHPAQLPREPYRVLAVTAAELAPSVRAALERVAAGRGRRLFTVERDERLLLLADDSSHAAVAGVLAVAGARAGVSGDARWGGLDDAVAQAAAALAAAPAGGLLGFEELVDGTVFGLLASDQVAELARLRLGELRGSPGGRERLREAAVWLRANGAWDPAARELGLHRHTLKLRIADLGAELGLDLDGFAGRAELWALLAAVDLD